VSFEQSVVIPMVRPADYPLDDLLAGIRRIGYSAVEFWNRGPDFEELLASLRHHDLRLVNMVGHEHVSPTDGKHAEGLSRRRNHDRLESELAVSIDIAAANGVPDLIVFTGHRNEGESDVDALLVCAEGLKRIAPYAERKGVNLNVEIFNTKIDHPRYLCDRFDWAVALCEIVGSPRVKILFDVYHVQIMEGDVIRSIQKGSRWIGHYHTGGNPGRHELDDTQELNYRGICRAIAATGYQGFVGHEFIPTRDPIVALEEAFQICNVE